MSASPDAEQSQTIAGVKRWSFGSLYTQSHCGLRWSPDGFFVAAPANPAVTSLSGPMAVLRWSWWWTPQKPQTPCLHQLDLCQMCLPVEHDGEEKLLWVVAEAVRLACSRRRLWLHEESGWFWKNHWQMSLQTYQVWIARHHLSRVRVLSAPEVQSRSPGLRRGCRRWERMKSGRHQ